MPLIAVAGAGGGVVPQPHLLGQTVEHGLAGGGQLEGDVAQGAGVSGDGRGQQGQQWGHQAGHGCTAGPALHTARGKLVLPTLL